MNKKKAAKIKPEFCQDGIQWLVLEDDLKASGGAFLYLHEDINDGCLFDYWYETIKEAESSAYQRWGISESDWFDFCLGNNLA